MGNPEVEDNEDRENILLVVIISIVCMNLLLIYKVIIEARVKTSGSIRAKHLIIIMQACGDIFLGLFPLSIRFQGLLNDPPVVSIDCVYRILAHTYLFHLMPFVHAIGIIVLTNESFLYWRRHGANAPVAPRPRSSFCLRYLLVGFLPWILGVLIVMPLVLVGFDFEMCAVLNYSLFRIKSFYWITIILPGLLAFITASAYLLSSVPRPFAIPSSTHTLLQGKNYLPTYNEAVQSSAGNTKTVGDNTRSEILRFSHKVSDFSNGKSRFYDYTNPCPECGMSSPDDYLRASQEMVMTGGGYETSSSLENVSSTIAWEKRSRIAGAILFCACSMPGAFLDLFFLSGLSNYDSWPDFVQVSTGVEALYRLHVLRSLISPLIWINEYS